MLTDILKKIGLKPKQAKIYLACLELNNSPASSIARHTNEDRVNTYNILKKLHKNGIISETIKNKTKYYSAISPEKLLKLQEEKSQQLKEALPEFMAIFNSNIHKPKVYFHEGFDELKKLFKEIMNNKEMGSDEAFLTFLGTSEIDPKFEDYLINEFVPRRLKNKRKTKAIVSKNNTQYANYNTEKHETVVIDDPIFDMGNEIVIYGKSKVAILMYSSKEMSGLIIESQTLHDGLKNLFNLTRKTYKK